MSVNKAILIGRLGKDPETFSIGADTSVTKFSIATDKKFKDRDGNEKKDTQWHQISVWGKQGEVCAKYLTKGREVYVEGEIRHNEGEKNGVKVWYTEIRANDVRFIGGNASGGNTGGSSEPAAGGGGGFGATPGDEQIPF